MLWFVTVFPVNVIKFVVFLSKKKKKKIKVRYSPRNQNNILYFACHVNTSSFPMIFDLTDTSKTLNPPKILSLPSMFLTHMINSIILLYMRILESPYFWSPY